MRLPSKLLALAYLTLSAIAGPADLGAIQKGLGDIIVATGEVDKSLTVGVNVTVIYNDAWEISNLNEAATAVVKNTSVLTDVEGKAVVTILLGQFAPLATKVLNDLTANKSKFQASIVITILTSLRVSTKNLIDALIAILQPDIRSPVVTVQSTLDANFVAAIEAFK